MAIAGAGDLAAPARGEGGRRARASWPARSTRRWTRSSAPSSRSASSSPTRRTSCARRSPACARTSRCCSAATRCRRRDRADLLSDLRGADRRAHEPRRGRGRARARGRARRRSPGRAAGRSWWPAGLDRARRLAPRRRASTQRLEPGVVSGIPERLARAGGQPRWTTPSSGARPGAGVEVTLAGRRALGARPRRRASRPPTSRSSSTASTAAPAARGRPGPGWASRSCARWPRPTAPSRAPRTPRAAAPACGSRSRASP